MPPRLQNLTFLAGSFAGGIALTLVLLFFLKPNIIQDLVGDDQDVPVEPVSNSPSGDIDESPLQDAEPQESTSINPTSSPSHDETTTEETQESLNQDRFSESEYVRNVRNAETSLSYIDPNTRIRFPLGVNHPLSLSNAEIANSGHDAIGYINNSGQATSFTAGELIDLLSLFPEISDLQETSDVPTIDLIFINPQNNGIYSAPNVSLIGIFRDLVNSVNNQTIKTSDIDLSQLNLPRTSQSSEGQ